VLPPELASDRAVVTKKAGLTPWHERLLGALERIADYYDRLAAEQLRESAADLRAAQTRKGKSDA